MDDVLEAKHRVAILVLNFNGKDFLPECLTSLQMTKWPNRIYLVDNASSDGSVDFVEKNFQHVRVIQHSSNYGFCEGYNRAVGSVEEDYILLLNNDTVVENPDWLGNMMRPLLFDNRVAVVGAKLLDYHQREILDAVGGTVLRWIGIGVRLGAGERDLGQYDNPPVEPFCVLGAALLMKRILFAKAGGFDPLMFAYSEELDLCWRLRLMGFKVKYCPRATVLHHASGSWSRKNRLKFYLASRNFLRACLKNYSATSLVREIPPYLTVNLLGAVTGSIVTRNPGFYTTLFRSLRWNLANLSTTLRERLFIQSQRVVDEREVLEAMGNQRVGSLKVVLAQLRQYY